jgi:hypothetical protein
MAQNGFSHAEDPSRPGDTPEGATAGPAPALFQSTARRAEDFLRRGVPPAAPGRHAAGRRRVTVG